MTFPQLSLLIFWSVVAIFLASCSRSVNTSYRHTQAIDSVAVQSIVPKRPDDVQEIFSITKKWEDDQITLVESSITLINDNVLIIEGQIWFAKQPTAETFRVSRNVYLIELKNVVGQKRWLLLNKNTDNAFIMKGNKILVQYFNDGTKQ